MTEPSLSAQRLLKLPPVRRLSDQAEIFAAPDFFLAPFCAEIIEHSEANLRPSTLADDNGDPGFRTSTTSDLPPDLPAVAHGRMAIAQLLGLPLTHAEPLQAQRYAVGQQFKPHCDWFRPTSPDFARHCAISGQRTWTAMAYMNNVEAGGETVFPQLGLSVRPEAGLLLLWNNLDAGGTGLANTLHHALPVSSGVKYVVTQWFRQSDYHPYPS